jgi:FixJ family two-component response regulator
VLQSGSGSHLIVSVVDDDVSVRESLQNLLAEFGYTVGVFSSAEEFLASDCVGRTGCLILDIAMPGMSGPDLHRELSQRKRQIPIIYVTALENERLHAQVISDGAVECLVKPFSETALIEALERAGAQP